MPTYEYKCRRCLNRFELRRSFSDNGVPVACPKCSGEAHRVFTPVPIIFKGSGFYVTDNKAPQPTGSSEESKESTKESAKESKSESKEESSATKSKDDN